MTVTRASRPCEMRMEWANHSFRFLFCNRHGRDARVTGVVFFVLISATFASAATRATSRPVDPLAQPARDAVKSRSLPAFGGEAEKQLRAELAKGADLKPAEVLRLSTWREFARYFARVNTTSDGHHDTLAWLAGQPDILNVVMMTVS